MLQIHVLKFIATCTCRWCFEYEVYLYFEHVDIYTHIMYMYALILYRKKIYSLITVLPACTCTWKQKL